jgi:prenyltransferase beta subunit
MKFRLALLVCAFQAVAAAQTAEEKAATVKYVLSLRDPATGAYKVTPDGKPSLRACNGAVKAIKYLGGELPEPEKMAAFVLSCYDPKTGAFAEPGGKPDVAITSIGVMAAVESGVPKEKFAKAMDYLEAHAKTFEEMRIAAAGVEAFGVKECGIDLGPWLKAAAEVRERKVTTARALGSAAAFELRLGRTLTKAERSGAANMLRLFQRDDGGWGKDDEKQSDLETTYRVMRAFHLLNEKPSEVSALRKFLASCRNADGGYGVTPRAPSSMSGVYYAAIVSMWLDDTEK